MNSQELTNYKSTYPTRNDLLKAWSEWLASNDDWQLFTLTVVYKASGSKANPEKWESFYRTKVLQKIRRALEPNSKNQKTAIPFEDFFYYEFDQASIFKTTKSRKPHHIHGVIPIRKSQLTRVWSTDENTIHANVYRDILSINEVQSIDIQPLIKGHEIDWIKYCAKGKISA